MKTKIKQIGMALIAIVMLVVVFQVSSSKAVEVVPVSGCEYTGNPNQYCSKNGGGLEIYNCVNTYSVTSCGIVIEDIDPNP
jgi:hypothetical protein